MRCAIGIGTLGLFVVGVVGGCRGFCFDDGGCGEVNAEERRAPFKVAD